MRPHLPKPYEPENSHFHPPVKFAVEAAIDNLDLKHKYIVKSQFPSPTGPIDLVIYNTHSSKVALPIEVKRSKMDVRGGGRRQARDYWQNLSTNRETKFYCVTNIEISEIFRFDERRPRTDSQQLAVSNEYEVDLNSDKESSVYVALVKFFEETILLLEDKTEYEYKNGLIHLEENVRRLNGSPSILRSYLQSIIFEYIRAHARPNTELGAMAKKWKNAQFYENNRRIIDLLIKAGFLPRAISKELVEVPFELDSISLEEAANSGSLGGQGQDLAELVHQSIYKQGLGGVVETDSELVALLYAAGITVLGSPKSDGFQILDPAAGSGSILSQVCNLSSLELEPVNFCAIESNPVLFDLLELRLALTLDGKFSASNRPTLFNGNLADQGKDIFSNVEIVIMNPPYLSGVASKDLKEILEGRIAKLTDSPSIVATGQASLEGVFLELLTNLVPIGTTIATVFPSQILSRQSNEAGVLRQWLIEKFGLQYVIQYPADGLFSNLTKQTLILVGQTGTKSEKISHVEIEVPLRNLDTREFSKALGSDPEFSPILKRNDFESDELVFRAFDGWRFIHMAAADAIEQNKLSFDAYPKLGDLEQIEIRRGTVGNGGNTKFTVFPKSRPERPRYLESIPETWVRGVLNRTKKMPRIISADNCNESSILPPASAYVAGNADHILLLRCIEKYLSEFSLPQGAQSKAKKTTDEILKNLKADQRDLGSFWAVIQRASRKFGEVSYMQDPVLISSNALLLRHQDPTATKLLALWFLSIFGQLQLELQSVNQEGMRKLELANLKQVIVPDLSTLTEESIQEILSCFNDDPVDFQKVQIRLVDIAWAKALWGEKHHDVLQDAKDNLVRLIDDRKGLGAN